MELALDVLIHPLFPYVTKDDDDDEDEDAGDETKKKQKQHRWSRFGTSAPLVLALVACTTVVFAPLSIFFAVLFFFPPLTSIECRNWCEPNHCCSTLDLFFIDGPVPNGKS